ncbi:hypothetical protein [Nostoc sp. NMS4]|uniref:hypothetical protein n=1 Tax=Nostoc sp. NMS4 TaxID=2815390 RepID=UPI0025FDDEA5|nr:hypothetical protein [Nostoc sp. NMS4]MBN3927651.1 hypothetical protein [Nostoc sp. NMS4]
MNSTIRYFCYAFYVALLTSADVLRKLGRRRSHQIKKKFTFTSKRLFEKSLAVIFSTS